jgi:hypothetical protein
MLVYRFDGEGQCQAHGDAWLDRCRPRSAQMMLVVFATLSTAVLAAYYGPRWLAVPSMLACLALSIGLFLFEVYSPEYGFRMPWLQVQLDAFPHVWSRGDHS